MPTVSAHVKLTAIVAALAFVVTNAMFYVFSVSYFEAHHQMEAGHLVPMFSPAQITTVRMSFALFTSIVAIASVLSQMWPRAIGHGIPVVLGIGYIIAAVAAVRHAEVTTALPATLFITGGLMPVLAHFSFHHRARGAWAFLIAICGVFAVVEFFGAPKVRGALDIGLWITMILPGLNAVAVWALVSVRDQYRDQRVDRGARPARTAA
jgi:hypothetical protein